MIGEVLRLFRAGWRIVGADMVEWAWVLRHPGGLECTVKVPAHWNIDLPF